MNARREILSLLLPLVLCRCGEKNENSAAEAPGTRTPKPPVPIEQPIAARDARKGAKPEPKQPLELDDAVERLNEISKLSKPAEIRRSLVELMGEIEVDSVDSFLALAHGLPVGRISESAFGSLCDRLASHPEAVLTDLHRLAEELTDEQFLCVLIELASDTSKSGMPLRHVIAKVEAADLDESSRTAALSVLFNSHARMDPRTTLVVASGSSRLRLQLIASATNRENLPSNADEAAELVRRIDGWEARADLLMAQQEQYSYFAPEVAVEAAALLAAEDPRLEFLQAQSFLSWAKQDLNGALSWLGDQPTGPGRDSLIEAALPTIEAEDPSAAIEWSEQLSGTKGEG